MRILNYAYYLEDTEYEDDIGVYAECGERCSLLAVNVFDSYNTAITPNYFSLVDGSCRDTVNSDDFLKLAINPPPLEESYYKCRTGRYRALLIALGVASGATKVFAPLCLFFIFPLVFIYFSYHGVSVDSKYSDFDKEIVANKLALICLKIADGNLDDVPKDSLLYQLTQELIKVEKKDSNNEEKSESGKNILLRSLSSISRKSVDSAYSAAAIHPNEEGEAISPSSKGGDSPDRIEAGGTSSKPFEISPF